MMFRCDWCENYFDKSECEANPLDDCSNICWECLATWEEKHTPRPAGFDIEAWAYAMRSDSDGDNDND